MEFGALTYIDAQDIVNKGVFFLNRNSRPITQIPELCASMLILPLVIRLVKVIIK